MHENFFCIFFFFLIFNRNSSFIQNQNFFCIFSFYFTVPPNIDDTLTSSDVIVREGANVTLRCRATGSPIPSIKWKRDDGNKISINKDIEGKFQNCLKKKEEEEEM